MNDNSFKRINSGKGKLIYLYIEQAGTVSITGIKENLHLSLLSVYKYVDCLEQMGLVKYASDNEIYVLE